MPNSKNTLEGLKMKRLLVSSSLLAKAMVGTYTRADGVTVKAHDSGRNAAHDPSSYGGVSSMRKRVTKRMAGDKVSPTHDDDASSHHQSFNSDEDMASKKSEWHGHLADHGFSLSGEAPNSQGGTDSTYTHPAGLSAKMSTHSVRGKLNAARTRSPHRRTLLASVNDEGSAAKTGSAAPAKMSNIGTAKYPMHVKSSDKLGAKHADGSTHHVGGFEAPSSGKGDHAIHHDGRAFTFTGKAGKNLKSGEDSFEYSHHDEGKGEEHRAWVTRSGHAQND
jgi:hypothetical protein